MTCSLCSLAVSYGVLQHTEHTGAVGGICVASVLSFVAFFSFSWGPIAWIVPSELIPLRLRARVVAAGTVANWIADYLVISTFLGLTDTVGDQGAFMIYCGINAAATVFVFLLVPETKGLELELISDARRVQISDSGRS
jgi:hypothetical protein